MVSDAASHGHATAGGNPTTSTIGNATTQPMPWISAVSSDLSLPDLIHSKETVRASDWSDVSLLEEFWDARLFRQAVDGTIATSAALQELRSRRGFERWFGTMSRPSLDDIVAAIQTARCVITQAFLIPCTPQIALGLNATKMEPIIEQKLRTLTAGSALHFSLVEAIRRQYKLAAQAKDRADKEAATLRQPPPNGK